MKRSSPHSPNFAPFFRKIFLLRKFEKSGAALLIALCFLVLLSAVVLALFSTASTGRRNATTFATGQETMRLADAAVNLVQGQIRDATIQPRVGWASQPGMVRAFDTAGTVTAYKLYSSDAMVVPAYGKTQIDAEFTQIQSWNSGATGKSFNALFADLNAPAVVKRPDPATPTQNIDTPVFPIADPAAIGAVEGFSATTTVAGTTLGNGTNRRLPMPVKWIYVLKDGQMTAPSGGTATRATFGNGTVPTEANPIVGRIAFWADDDTCKLNINTASEGSFWDAPKASTVAESRMSISMPVAGEFHRTAGHPASTSLSPVLGSIIPPPDTLIGAPGTQIINLTNFSNYIATGGDAYFRRFVEYMNLTPRVSWRTDSGDHLDTSNLGNAVSRTSRGGTRRTTVVPDQWLGSVAANAMPGFSWGTDPWYLRNDRILLPTDSRYPNAPVTPDSDRLYPTTDELMFRPDRSNNHSSLNAADLSKRDFFLTAQSRAPETTLFGTPRISLWPLNTTDSSGMQDRTVKDRLLSFVSSIGKDSSGNPYVYSFQRGIASKDGVSVGESTAIGFLMQNSLLEEDQPADSSTADSSLPTNRNLVNYLRAIGGASMPGYTGRFASKWGTQGVDRAIVQTFDLIRAKTAADYVSQGNVTYRYAATAINPRKRVPLSGGSDPNLDIGNGPRGYVVPARLADNSNAKGAGSLMHVVEVPIIFMAAEVENTYGSNGTLNLSFNPGVAGAGDTSSANSTFSIDVGGNSTSVISGTALSYKGSYTQRSNGDHIVYSLLSGVLTVTLPGNATTTHTISPVNNFTIATGWTNMRGNDPSVFLNASDHFRWPDGFIDPRDPDDSNDDVVAGFFDNFKIKLNGGGWSANGFELTDSSSNSLITAQKTNTVRAFLLPQLFNPTPGWEAVAPAMRMELVNGENLKINNIPLFRARITTRFGGSTNARMWSAVTDNFPNSQYQFTALGPNFRYAPRNQSVLFDFWGPNNTVNAIKFANSQTTSDMDADYGFISAEIPVSGSTMDFSGGQVQLKLQSWKQGEDIQTINLNFPQAPGIAIPQHLNSNLRFVSAGNLQRFTSSAGNGGSIALGSRQEVTSGSFNKTSTNKFPISPPLFGTNGGLDSTSYSNNGHPLTIWRRLRGNGNSQVYTDNIVRPGDLVLSLAIDSSTAGATAGDLRLVALEGSVPSSWFAPVTDYGQCTQQMPGTSNYSGGANGAAFRGRFAHRLQSDAYRSSQYGYQGDIGWLLSGSSVTQSIAQSVSGQGLFSFSSLVPGLSTAIYARPAMDSRQQGALMKNGQLGDFSSGYGPTPDGASLYSPDMGKTGFVFGGYFGLGVGGGAGGAAYRYVDTSSSNEPNRFVPSAGHIGSIITTNNSGTPQPWQTLLFNPVPAAGSSHPGFESPPDHLFLDNFWMPVVDPYPISDPLSTAGKININAQMAPFNHIERTTAFRGALKSIMLSAVADDLPSFSQAEKYSNNPKTYKINRDGQDYISKGIRLNLNLDETIKKLNERFTSGDIYRSATAVSEIPLVPEGSTAANVNSWWNSYRPTSDTLREQPYTALLSRVTTKSNTFTVHFRVQALRQPPRPGRDWAEWDEGRDQVVGEYRGSTTIERFLDPNATDIPDYTQVNLSGNYQPIDRWYRWRVLSQKQFAP